VVVLSWQGARRRSLAVWVREKILQLGPTFIKLGQLSSTRSDLFPAEIVEELAKLQVLSYVLSEFSTSGLQLFRYAQLNFSNCIF
jgi:D-lyxose ketol-isomerase